ncbi:MAG: SDR family oxidoreductase, partial [Alphaproteobacteria bacterium]
RHLADAGAIVVLNGRDANKGSKAAAYLGSGTRFVQGDITQANDRVSIIDQTTALAGPPAILVTNSGGPPPGQFMDHDDATWEAALRNNMLGHIDMARRCLPPMIEAGWGRIVNITSFAVREPYPNLVLANAVRAGLHGAMATLAREVADRGVTVNNVLPGLMDTPALQRVYNAQSQRENISVDDARARMAESIPAKRLGTAEDFGPAVAFMCSQHAGYITGQNLTVDGGLVRALL